ncbi:MAG TPA: substrate-binding domain-containing protein [Trebonia sp.]
MLALGLLQDTVRRHLSVPGDLAIVGYDDIEFAAAAAVPLTSVRQPPRPARQGRHGDADRRSHRRNNTPAPADRVRARTRRPGIHPPASGSPMTVQGDT